MPVVFTKLCFDEILEWLLKPDRAGELKFTRPVAVQQMLLPL